MHMLMCVVEHHWKLDSQHPGLCKTQLQNKVEIDPKQHNTGSYSSIKARMTLSISIFKEICFVHVHNSVEAFPGLLFDVVVFIT